MEDVVTAMDAVQLDELRETYRGRRVLVTGDTGFKGSWLCEWLVRLGANVRGIGLEPNTEPSLFRQLVLERRIDHSLVDVRDAASVRELVAETQPDIVLHLAAQALVRASYTDPVDTYATNVMGTAHVLDALRGLDKPCAAVFVTTDKCYENKEWLHSYREEDPMGGYDPYSSSKAACELAIASFRRSFFSDPLSRGIAIASARAGNVLGGGDWSVDRIVPDCIRSLSQNQPIHVRNPRSTRPWQHVLEPLSGYLLLASELWRGLNSQSAARTPRDVCSLCTAFNFGPHLDSNRTVQDLVTEILGRWPGKWSEQVCEAAPHEASLLNLAIDKAHHMLRWRPRWDFAATVRYTIDWYRAVCEEGVIPIDVTQSQIEAYTDANEQAC
jgi:CDP-glucose 4,6-dehydratase